MDQVKTSPSDQNSDESSSKDQSSSSDQVVEKYKVKIQKLRQYGGQELLNAFALYGSTENVTLPKKTIYVNMFTDADGHERISFSDANGRSIGLIQIDDCDSEFYWMAALFRALGSAVPI